jgi:chromosome segregation ATPase
MNDTFLESEKNTYINKLEYYQSAYKELRTKLKALEEEKIKSYNDFSKKLDIEKEKNTILQRQLQEKENKIESLNAEMLSLTNSNRDLITELRSINTILDNHNKHREVNLMEISFYKNELDLLKKNLKDTYDRLKQSDLTYANMSKKLLDYQSTVKK